MHDALGADGAGEEKCRITVARAELEHLARADRAREQEQLATDQRATMGKRRSLASSSISRRMGSPSSYRLRK